MKTRMSNNAQRVARLPAPGPVQVVAIPLDVWPTYQELHRLEIISRAEVDHIENLTGQRKVPGVVWVKRVPAGEQSS